MLKQYPRIYGSLFAYPHKGVLQFADLRDGQLHATSHGRVVQLQDDWLLSGRLQLVPRRAWTPHAGTIRFPHLLV